MIVRKIKDKYILQIDDSVENKNKDESNYLIKGSFTLDYIPSVNSQYIIHDSRKILDPELVKTRKKIWQQLYLQGLSQDLSDFNDKLTLEIGYYIIKNINKRDLDNFNKFIIDTIAQYFKFNDNRIYNLATYKRLLTNSRYELVNFRIKRLENSIVDDKSVDMRLINGNS